MIARFINWFTTPQSSPHILKHNFINVQVDAVGVAMAGAAAQFLPIYLTRLDATSFQISLLSTMPAVTGMFLALLLGRFLQGKANVVPWFSAARLVVILCYALTGLASLWVPKEYLINVILAIWAFATLPQTVVAISFSVVMNAVAGPTGRFELMTHRWSILGFTTTVTVLIVGQLLDRIVFPSNYQIMFLVLSLGGLLSFYFSSHITIPPNPTTNEAKAHNLKELVTGYTNQVTQEKPFISFISKRFVFLTGVALTAPLFPLFYVRVIHASDAWISAISTTQTVSLIVGYFFWSRQTRRHGSHRVISLTTLGLALYPILISLTGAPWQVALFAGFAGIFQAGLDLVFFDELMRTVPFEKSATFVAFAQSIQYISSIVSPLIGSALANSFSIPVALIIAGCIRLAGFAMFAFMK